MRRLYTWTSPNDQYWDQIDYILCSQRWRSCIQPAETRPGADCGSDHEVLIAKFRFKLKKVGKTTRSFRYKLNQIPYDYTAEVMNRFKRWELAERVLKQLWKFITLQRKKSRFIPISKKSNIKECSNYCTIVLISHGARLCSKSFKVRFNSKWTEDIQM